MGMWYMHTKTFLDVFVEEENPKKVLETQYVLVSGRIKKTRENQNVVSLHKLFPDAMLLSDFRSADKAFFETSYRRQLKENIVAIAILVQSAVQYNNMPIIFLCSRAEYKIGFMKILAEFIEDEFGYPVINYMKYKKKPSKISVVTPESIDDVKERCIDIIKKARKKQKAEKMRTREGRKELVKSMSKDELKKELADLNFYADDLSKGEMRELLLYFYDN